MITVRVQYYSILRRAAGLEGKAIDVPNGSTIRDALNHLVAGSGNALRSLLLTPEGGVVPYLVVFRNQRLVTHDQFDTKLIDGDELKLFPAVSGG